MIGVIANANAGKSTLVNAILGQKVLPQNFKCCTSVVTNVSLVDLDEPLMMYQGNETTGSQDILKKLKSMNEEVRREENVAVKDVSIFCKPSPKDANENANEINRTGMLKLVDMPGVDETDNEVVKASLEQLLSMCHGLWILTKYDAIQSDGLTRLIQQVQRNAPHLISGGAITFIISQVDQIRYDSDTEDEDERELNAIAGLKSALRTFLYNRFPDNEQWVDEVNILATSVDKRLTGGHDFHHLFDVLANTSQKRSDLIRARKTQLSASIGSHFKSLVQQAPAWPVAAQKAIEKQSAQIGFWIGFTAVSAVVTIPIGGAALWAGCAIRGVLAGAGAAIASLGGYLGASADGASTLGGQRVVGGGAVDAQGAQAALEKLKQENTEIVASHVQAGKKYKDVLMDCSGNKVLYVGEFRYKRPHGKGRLFWPSTQYEAFIGDFESGEPKKGNFLNEHGFFVGHMERAFGGWAPHGFQADDPTDPGLCSVCLDRPSMQVEQKFFQPCGHGQVCTVCAASLNECPLCREPVESIGRF